MSWLEGVDGLKAEIKKDMEANSLFLKLPDSGETKKYLLRAGLPVVEIKQWDGKTKKQYNYFSPEGKRLGVSETLALKMLEAVDKQKEQLAADQSTDVLYEISREGKGKSTVWFVAVRGGV